MRLGKVALLGLVAITALMTASAPMPAAASTAAVTVKLIGDGQMQVTSPDDDTEIHISHASVTFSNLPTIATAPCVAQASFPFTVVCPVDQVKSVLVLTGVGDDVVETLLGEVPLTVITGAGNDIVTDNSLNLNTVVPDLFLLGDGDDRAGFGNSIGVANDVFGGPGRDEVEYGNALSVSISLDDVANDGPLKDDSPVPTTRDDNIRSDVEDITGGAAADILIGSDSNNLIIGGGGTDTIRGLGGDDTVNGDGDFTFLFVDTDLIDGGAGTDTVSYDERSAPVNVSLDGVANDGAPGEADNVINTENIIGGGGGDTLTGNAAGNVIRGGGGDDTLAGGAGRDIIDGGGGTDTATYADHPTAVAVSLDGLANDGAPGEADNVIETENVIGGGGNDTLTGNAGPNFISGLGGNDQLRGLAGNDLLIGDTGADVADGGAGSDLCRAERVLSCP